MKKSSVIFLVLLMVMSMTACSQKTENSVKNASKPEVSVSSDEVLNPIYANEIKDGTYEITVDSSSSMFRVVKCELIVENEEMKAVMTMSGKGYGMVYMGTSKEALADSEDTYIPFVLNENEEKTFTVPVEALNMEIDCAAWSIKKETWYDRTLIFKSDLIFEDTTKISDGTYSVDAALTGGTGKTTIESATVTIENNSAVATIVWSSPFYEYMLIGDTRYEPIQESGNATFEIPIVFDEEMAVSASTVAMSQPHLIEYTLYFDSTTLKGEQ